MSDTFISRHLIQRFDEYLTKHDLELEAVVIGGTALNLLDVTDRGTIDVDILDPQLSYEIKLASEQFIKIEFPEISSNSKTINWLNNGPISLIKELPTDWRKHLQMAYDGRALKLYSLGRRDIILTKLFAYVDRGRDLVDLIALNISEKEIDESADWVKLRDANPK